MVESEKIELPLGGGAEIPETEHATTPADAFAAAIAMDEAAKDPAVSADASAFLQAQKRLVMLQAEHFDAEALKYAPDWVELKAAIQ